jgi:hypothetical protein
MKPALLPIVFVALAAGCQSGWVGQDGSAADAPALEQALAACRVERKLEALERARDERDAGLQQAASNQNKMQVREDFASVERQVMDEIDACMRQQGFTRGGN